MTEPIKLLLVDDTPENLVALEALVRREGVQVLMARSGAEALELLLRQDVALALLDVQMPEMDGFELAELMRGFERTKHVPIIFVTAGSRDPSRVFKGYETGAVDFLFKPIDPHILKSKVDVFLELADQRRQLSDALRLYEMFVAILSHDLRNPLGSLVAGAELLSVQISDERQLKTVERMVTAGHRMTSMIEQLLDLTRARLGGGIGFLRVREAIDVRELVHRSVEELRQGHPEREIAYAANSDCTTSGDPGRLLQLFGNLIANAIAHGTRGTPIAVTVLGRRNDIVVEVANQGAIPPERLATLFTPFQGRTTDASRSDGLGLGLFIARQIATAHGGDIAVESSTATGTSMTVRLPRNIDDLGRRTRDSGESPIIADVDPAYRPITRSENCAVMR
ncbi:MAG TPA: hybrid sensor histidine kinase/response regulator [Kofleriaceae bacterium]